MILFFDQLIEAHFILGTRYVPDTVPCAGNPAMNKPDRKFLTLGIYFLEKGNRQ